MATIAAAACEVDASVWRAVAGASVRIPAVNSYVYYFPEGHAEHCSVSSSVLHTYKSDLQRPMVPCQVLSVRFLSDPSSDRGFVKFLLRPLEPLGPRPSDVDDDDHDDGDGVGNDVVSFAKILTPSDANNGGGFSVPRFCADMIFPQLDFEADPPVQVLTLKDACNHAWEFRHIYRGTPRRHLLTTGWSKFVNTKRLVAGDSVIFMRKNSTNEMYIGIRRAVKFVRNNVVCNGGDVLEAIEKAAKGMAFEVVYYPKAGLPDFVVKAEKVKESLRMSWSTGIRVKISMETEDSSRMTWFQGTVQSGMCSNGGPWVGSPWRMLQVAWDEPECLQNVDRVNPWQVECIKPTLLPDSQFPCYKKLKLMQNPGMLQPDGGGDWGLPMPRLIPSTRHLNSVVLAYAPLPSGMQGVRLGRVSSKLCEAPKEVPENDKGPEGKTVSTILSIGNSHPDSLSPGSQNSVHLSSACPTAPLGVGHSFSSTTASYSFQLFGKTIQVSKPVGSCSKHNAKAVQIAQQH